jgi:hypothetical protein
MVEFDAELGRGASPVSDLSESDKGFTVVVEKFTADLTRRARQQV